MFVLYVNSPFPQYDMVVNGHTLTFLVDSGATRSVIRSTSLPKPPTLSGSCVYSVGSLGQTIKEDLNVPLCCKDSHGNTFRHSFMLSSLCPIILLGRGLMIRLRISLLSTGDGLTVVASNQQCELFVQCEPEKLLYVYEWKLQQTDVLTDTLTCLQSFPQVRSVDSGRLLVGCIVMRYSRAMMVSHAFPVISTHILLNWHMVWTRLFLW